MKSCQFCKYWDQDPRFDNRGECENIGTTDVNQEAAHQGAHIYDPTRNCEAVLHTNINFVCSLFEAEETR